MHDKFDIHRAAWATFQIASAGRLFQTLTHRSNLRNIVWSPVWFDDTTTPIEAGLTWTVGKRRRETGGFPGSEVLLGQINDGVARKRVGIRPEGRILAREGSEITDLDGKVIGAVTSGGFGPSAGGPVAMGYVETGFHKAGTDLALVVRAKSHPARVVKMPFAAHRYAK